MLLFDDYKQPRAVRGNTKEVGKAAKKKRTITHLEIGTYSVWRSTLLKSRSAIAHRNEYHYKSLRRIIATVSVRGSGTLDGHPVIFCHRRHQTGSPAFAPGVSELFLRSSKTFRPLSEPDISFSCSINCSSTGLSKCSGRRKSSSLCVSPTFALFSPARNMGIDQVR